jgi:lipopolysaccharide export system protein LptA
MRTLVLIAGALIVVAVVAFLIVAKWRNSSKTHDLPERLGINVTQQADHVIYTQTHGGHTLFKIDAAKVVQISNGVATLSDVTIDLYGAEGSRVDRIVGKEFQYDQKAGFARAVGPVEIILLKPGQAPAIAPKATPHGITQSNKSLATAVATAESEDIRVKTSGLIFDQKSGVAETKEHLDFILAQGSGSADGARFDSQVGHMILDHNLVMHLKHGDGTIDLQAAHAEFERGSKLCTLRNASMTERSTTAQAANATILFREDGSAEKLNATGSLKLTNTAGSTLTAPRGELEFDARNHPQRGSLEQGVVFDSHDGNSGAERVMHGTAPTAHMTFNTRGDLNSAHLEQSVDFSMQQTSAEKQTFSRQWHSAAADLAFQKNNKGAMLLQSIHGTGGATVKSDTERGAAGVMQADELTALLRADGSLASLKGAGHALIDQTNATGVRQTASGDALDANFNSESKPAHRESAHASASEKNSFTDLEHATITGHVQLAQAQPAGKLNASAPVHATAGRAEYEGMGEWLHLTQSPRLVNGGVELTATKIDFSRASGDAFAHSNVKATWADDKNSTAHASPGLGGQAPTHVVSNDAQLNQATNDLLFIGQARLWQGNNSVAAPRIILNRVRQTLVADGENAVNATFLSAGNKEDPKSTPQLIRFKGGLLKYSSAERKAWLSASVKNSTVSAETGTGTIHAGTIEVILLPTGVNEPGNSSAVDRVIARGNVQMNSQGRQGTGEQLVYSGESGEYTLTGPLGNVPKLTDPERGTISGETLIFSSRDDSVKVEGKRTTTETTTKR